VLDPSRFHRDNTPDTCAVWNLLSSRRLYAAARAAGCTLACTVFVRYECLYKRRKHTTPEDQELQQRLRDALDRREIRAFSLDIADLQQVELLKSRRRLSMGELSAIAFAQKTGRLAFLTDDKKARDLAKVVLAGGMVQTTPHLLGWLHYWGHLGDSDQPEIVREHNRFRRPLEPYFNAMYAEACRCRLLEAANKQPRQGS